VVIEFEGFARAIACYRPPEYAAAMALGQGVSTADIRVVEGYDGPQPSDASGSAPRRMGVLKDAGHRVDDPGFAASVHVTVEHAPGCFLTGATLAGSRTAREATVEQVRVSLDQHLQQQPGPESKSFTARPTTTPPTRLRFGPAGTPGRRRAR
jgi:hypothetical protein